MSDTLANQWRQRMAGRSALCAVLLAVPVAVAAQISFSAGLDNVPFGVSTLAAGPETSSIGAAGATAPSQNLATPVDGTGAAADAATSAAGTGGGPGTTVSGTTDVSGGFVPPTSPGGTGGPGPGDGGPNGPGSPSPTPPGPSPPTTPPAPTPDPPATPPAPQPVPGVNVPDVGGIAEQVTDPVDQATGGLVPGGG